MPTRAPAWTAMGMGVAVVAHANAQTATLATTASKYHNAAALLNIAIAPAAATAIATTAIAKMFATAAFGADASIVTWVVDWQ